RRRAGRRQPDAARVRRAQRHLRRRHPRFRQLYPRHLQRRASRSGQRARLGANRARLDRRLHQHVLQAAAADEPPPRIGGGPGGDNLTLRGFGARNDIFVDGIRDFASYTRDTFNVEQVEVVKGPASAQTGRGSTGGYINMFSKQPQLMSFVRGSVAGGAPNYARATFDINLGEDRIGLGGGTAVRLNGMYHNADAPGRDFVESERMGLAPSVAVGLGSSTRAILSYLYLRQNNQPDYGIPFVPATNTALAEYADQPAPVDFDNYYGLTKRDYEKTRTHML